MDLEFIAQYLQLLHAHERPEVLAGGTAACFEALAGAGLLDGEEARFLAGAVRMQRALQGLVRLTWNEETPVRDAPEPLRRKLAAALECTGFDELEDRLRATQERAFDLYQERVGGPAERAVRPGFDGRNRGRAPAHRFRSRVTHKKNRYSARKRIRPVPAKWVLLLPAESRA